MHKVGFIRAPTTGLIIVKDGLECYCPFVQPIVVASKIQGGSAELQRMSCNTTCPHCNLSKNAEKYDLTISCGAGMLYEDVREIIVEEKKPGILTSIKKD